MFWKFFEFVGVFVIALFAGVSGGIGAMTVLQQNPDAPCGINPLCVLSRAVIWPGRGSDVACQNAADIRLIAKFTATLVDSRPLDTLEKKIADAIGAGAGKCASIESVLITACKAVEGGNVRSTEACAAIKSALN